MVSLMGTNAGGHLGWVTKRCKICNRKLIVGKDVVYICPKCSITRGDICFCPGDHKVLHGRCPYCGSELIPVLS